jgi:hypothetical protein
VNVGAADVGFLEGAFVGLSVAATTGASVGATVHASQCAGHDVRTSSTHPKNWTSPPHPSGSGTALHSGMVGDEEGVFVGRIVGVAVGPAEGLAVGLIGA